MKCTWYCSVECVCCSCCYVEANQMVLISEPCTGTLTALHSPQTKRTRLWPLCDSAARALTSQTSTVHVSHHAGNSLFHRRWVANLTVMNFLGHGITHTQNSYRLMYCPQKSWRIKISVWWIIWGFNTQHGDNSYFQCPLTAVSKCNAFILFHKKGPNLHLMPGCYSKHLPGNKTSLL